MRLSDLISRLSPTQYTEIALILFLAVFAAVAIRAFQRSQRAVHDAARLAPLADDAAPRGETGGGA
jgi:cbb3-type cytochrome oxidase subunit 3